MEKIAVLITSYNRWRITVESLKSLYVAMQRTAGKQFDIYLVDDNSPDKTGEKVKEMFPDIHIIYGTGSLFWGGGMNLAWKTAAKACNYDYYIWFNDDTFLHPDALQLLWEPVDRDKNALIVGAFVSGIDGKITYSGKVEEQGELLSPDGIGYRSVKLMNGNLVLISRATFQQVGFIDPHFRHARGDYDYGLRAISKGYRLLLTKRPVGICERHDHVVFKSFNKKVSLSHRFRSLYTPLGPDPWASFVYMYRHYGIWDAARLFLAIHKRTLFP